MFKLFRKSEKEKEASAVQPIPAARKSVPTVTKKPEKANSSPVLANRSSAPGPGKELVSGGEGEKVRDKDFLLTEMQALLDPKQSGRVKGEELRHILASIGNRLSEEDLALVKSFEDKDGMIEYRKFLETIIKI